MSALGHLQIFPAGPAMSDLPLEADMGSQYRHVG